MRKQFKKNDNNLAIAYYRYSSHAQNEASIEWQQNLANKYADDNGLTIVKEYSDEALSGRDDTRPQYRLMLSEIHKIKPSTLLIYKTDRLARDKYELVVSRRAIRDAGVEIIYTGEPNLDPNQPVSVFLEGALDAMAEFYSLNLSQNVLNGLMNNAQKGLYNGYKIFGFGVDDSKHYVLDEDTAPVVLRIYNQYSNGISMQQIANELTTQGIKTSRGNNFTVNSLSKVLSNRAYIGEYSYNGVVIPGGMPRIISDELFEDVQKRKKLNKHKTKPANDALAPRFWLTGKLKCGLCMETLHGISGTSRNGTKHYYYTCNNNRKHKCGLKYLPKDTLEFTITEILRNFLSDSEKLASLAVDVSNYAKKMYADDTYIKSLKAEKSKTDKEIMNIVNAIKQGCFSKTINDTLVELEQRRDALSDAIEQEQIKLSLSLTNNSIEKYFKMYAEADFDDETTRDRILDYFVDCIYVFPDKLVINLFYSDDHTEVNLDSYFKQYDYAKDSVFVTEPFSGAQDARVEPYKNRLLLIYERI